MTGNILYQIGRIKMEETHYYLKIIMSAFVRKTFFNFGYFGQKRVYSIATLVILVNLQYNAFEENSLRYVFYCGMTQ